MLVPISKPSTATGAPFPLNPSALSEAQRQSSSGLWSVTSAWMRHYGKKKKTRTARAEHRNAERKGANQYAKNPPPFFSWVIKWLLWVLTLNLTNSIDHSASLVFWICFKNTCVDLMNGFPLNVPDNDENEFLSQGEVETLLRLGH